MLDVQFVRDNLDIVKVGLKKRGVDIDIDAVIEADEARRRVLQEVEKLRSERNKISQEPFDKAQGKQSDRAKDVKEQLKELDAKFHEADKKARELLAGLPNIPHESVPSKEEGNRVEGTRGEKPTFDFTPKDHLDLGMALDIIDVERAAKVSGSRFGYLKNEAALLEFALVRWVFDKLTKEGFTPMVPPILVKEMAMFGTGFFPTEKMEYYKTAEDDLYLSGTAEVPLAAYHADEVLDGLPKKYAGFSTCFRREAGSYGKDVRGILRVHQFDKVEMFGFTDPEKSWEEFEMLRRLAESICQELGLHYQTVTIHAGDLGAPNTKKYDIEVWLPSQHTYREITSCSHDTDFQARRLNIKMEKNGKRIYVHTLNSTAIAVGRTIIAILENYQRQDGSIAIPGVLHSYLPFTEIKK